MPITRYEPGFLLIEDLMGFLVGESDKQVIWKDLKNSRIGLEKIRENFETDLSLQDQETRDAANDEILVVNKFFDDWNRAFGAIETYFETGIRFDLISALEMVKRCSDGMNFALENYRLQVLKSMGPTDIPNLNLLINSITEVLEGVPIEKLQKILEIEYVIAGGAIKELEQERKKIKFMEQELLIKAYKELQQALSTINQSVKEENEELLDQGIEECKRIYPMLRVLIPLVNYNRMIQKPTKSPAANLLINMAKALKKGAIGDEMFARTLEDSEKKFVEMKTQIEMAAEKYAEDSVDEVILDELEKALDGLDTYHDAIEDYHTFLEDREHIFLNRAELELKDASEILEGSIKFFGELGEREGKVPCIRCGHYNLPNRRTCEKCNAIVPMAADTIPQPTFEVSMGKESQHHEQVASLPANLIKMFTAIDQVAVGQISTREFEETINWLENIMETNKTGGTAPLPRIRTANLSRKQRKETEQYLKDMKRVKELFSRAYQEWSQALNLFREYIISGNQNLLTDGVALMLEGNKKLDEVRKLTQPFMTPARR